MRDWSAPDWVNRADSALERDNSTQGKAHRTRSLNCGRTRVLLKWSAMPSLPKCWTPALVELRTEIKERILFAAREIAARGKGDKMPSGLSCPRCKCGAVHRSRRRGALDWLMSLMNLRPMRCFTCEKRFYTGYLFSKDKQRQKATTTRPTVGETPRRAA